MQVTAVREKIAKLGVQPMSMTAEQFAALPLKRLREMTEAFGRLNPEQRIPVLELPDGSRRGLRSGRPHPATTAPAWNLQRPEDLAARPINR